MSQMDVFSIVTYLALEVYARLNVMGQWFGAKDLVAQHYLAQISQAVGRNTGFRQKNDTKAVVVASKSLLRLIRGDLEQLNCRVMLQPSLARFWCRPGLVQRPEPQPADLVAPLIACAVGPEATSLTERWISYSFIWFACAGAGGTSTLRSSFQARANSAPITATTTNAVSMAPPNSRSCQFRFLRRSNLMCQKLGSNVNSSRRGVRAEGCRCSSAN